MEIETDKVTVEIEAPASGTLRGVLAHAGDVVPVGQTIAWILSPGESLPASSPNSFIAAPKTGSPVSDNGNKPQAAPLPGAKPVAETQVAANTAFEVSPLARNIAVEHGVDLSLREVLRQADRKSRCNGLYPGAFTIEAIHRGKYILMENICRLKDQDSRLAKSPQVGC